MFESAGLSVTHIVIVNQSYLIVSGKLLYNCDTQSPQNVKLYARQPTRRYKNANDRFGNANYGGHCNRMSGEKLV